jgi:hypothetical protein
MVSSIIEPATSRFVAEYLNELRDRVPASSSNAEAKKNVLTFRGLLYGAAIVSDCRAPNPQVICA